MPQCTGHTWPPLPCLMRGEGAAGGSRVSVQLPSWDCGLAGLLATMPLKLDVFCRRKPASLQQQPKRRLVPAARRQSVIREQAVVVGLLLAAMPLKLDVFCRRKPASLRGSAQHACMSGAQGADCCVCRCHADVLLAGNLLHLHAWPETSRVTQAGQ